RGSPTLLQSNIAMRQRFSDSRRIPKKNTLHACYPIRSVLEKNILDAPRSLSISGLSLGLSSSSSKRLGHEGNHSCRRVWISLIGRNNSTSEIHDSNWRYGNSVLNYDLLQNVYFIQVYLHSWL